MEQGNRLDSTPVSTRHEARDGSANEPALNMAITALLTRPWPEAKAPVSHLGEMVAEWSAMLQRENGGGIEAEEAEKHAPKRIALQFTILTTPVTSLSDLAAKIPLFRDELESVTPWDQGPETLPVAAWKAVVRDIGVLAHPQPVAQATMMDTDTGQPLEDLATACVEQIARLEQWDANPGAISEKQGNEEMDRWGAVFRRAIHEPSNSLRDLAGKAYLMLADLDRFEPEEADDKHNDRLMRVIVREAIAMGGLTYPAPAHFRAVVDRRDGDTTIAVPVADALDLDRHADAFHAAATDLRWAKREYERSVNFADRVWVEQNGGDLSHKAMALAEAARDAAGARQNQAWRDLFKVRPRTNHQMWLLLRDVAAHFDDRQGMENEPDVFGALIGAADGLRADAPELVAPHDLTRLSIAQLEDLTEICSRQSRAMRDARKGTHESPLGSILEDEQYRIGRLGGMASDEIERRVPVNDEDRDLRLETLARADLAGNGYIEPKLLSELVAAWGAR